MNLSDKIIEKINNILEIVPPRIRKPGAINHRNEKEKDKEKERRRTQDYRMWRKNYNRKRELPGYRPDFDTRKAAERSAKHRRTDK